MATAQHGKQQKADTPPGSLLTHSQAWFNQQGIADQGQQGSDVREREESIR